MHLLSTCTGSNASFMLVFMPRFLHLYYTLFFLPFKEGNISQVSFPFLRARKCCPWIFCKLLWRGSFEEIRKRHSLLIHMYKELSNAAAGNQCV